MSHSTPDPTRPITAADAAVAVAADEVFAALRSGHDDLAALVTSLAPDRLRTPSGASAWDVSQVLSHLGSGAVITLATLEAALGGGPAPGIDANRVVWSRWDAMSPDDRAEGFLRADTDLLARFDSLNGETRATLKVDLGFLPAPVDVATAARFRLNEFALHSWDVRVAFNPSATVRPETVPLLLDHVGLLLGWTGRTAALGGREVTVDVHLHDPDRGFGLRLADQVTVVDRPAAPDAVLMAPGEAWLRLATGRLGPAHTPADVAVTGVLDLDTLRAVFPGY